jgi:hypothetical protein
MAAKYCIDSINLDFSYAPQRRSRSVDGNHFDIPISMEADILELCAFELAGRYYKAWRDGRAKRERTALFKEVV